MTLAARLEGESRPLRLAAGGFLLLLGSGLALQLYRLDAQSLWLDELWTAASSDPALSFRRWVEEWLLPDVHPPLHLLLLRGWRSLFGGSELALRLPSLLAAAGLVAAVLLLHRRMPVVRQPLALAAWLACAPGVVHFAQEARAYSLLILLSGVATLLAVAVAQRMERGERLRRPLVALVAVVVLAEYSHYFGALLAGGLFGSLFLFAACWHRRHLPAILLSGTFAVGALLPWLLLHSYWIADKLGGNFWVTNNWWWTLYDLMKLIAGRPLAFMILATVVAAILACHPRLLRRPACWVPFWTLLLAPLGALLISLHTPVVTSRNLLILLPSFLLLTVAALTDYLDPDPEAPPRRSTPVLLLLVVASLLLTLHRVETRERDDWRGAAARIAALPGCAGATLQVYYWHEDIYAYYLPPAYREGLRRVSLVPADPPGLAPLLAPEPGCPLIVWTGHLVGSWLVPPVLDQLGLAEGEVVVWRNRGNMLLLDARRLPADW